MIDVQLSRLFYIAHPFGDARTVAQAFPGAVPAEVADPFLMCDYFSSVEQNGPSPPDVYPVNWHPHAGIDLLSYMKEGFGRHADSMGNRETFQSPGMQWITSGVCTAAPLFFYPRKPNFVPSSSLPPFTCISPMSQAVASSTPRVAPLKRASEGRVFRYGLMSLL